MKTMNLLIALLFSTCGTYNVREVTHETGLFLEVIYNGTYELSKNDSTFLFLVDVRLINNTSSECKFMAFSCATASSIICDSEDVKICSNQCAGNALTTILVDPNQELSIPVIFQISKEKAPFSTKPIKFGLMLFPVHDFNVFNYNEVFYKMKRNEEHIIWSEPLYLNTAGGHPFEIM